MNVSLPSKTVLALSNDCSSLKSIVLLGVYVCGKIRRGVNERNERRELNELVLHCDNDGLVERKLSLL